MAEEKKTDISFEFQQPLRDSFSVCQVASGALANAVRVFETATEAWY